MPEIKNTSRSFSWFRSRILDTAEFVGCEMGRKRVYSAESRRYLRNLFACVSSDILIDYWQNKDKI